MSESGKLFQRVWKKGYGFYKHRHSYDHTIKVLEGSIRVIHGGLTTDLSIEDGPFTHKAGWPLTGWATSEQAVIEADHRH